MSLGLTDVIPHKFVSEGFPVDFRVSEILVHESDVFGHQFIFLFISLIQKQENKIKTGK
jgi:hypothetical protein